jgi:hypothetical protein
MSVSYHLTACFLSLVIITGCESQENRRQAERIRQLEAQIAKRAAQDSALLAAALKQASVPTKTRPVSDTYTRCLRAAHVQTRAHDETFGGYSATQNEAREANIQMLCKIAPQTFLPDLN